MISIETYTERHYGGLVSMVLSFREKFLKTMEIQSTEEVLIQNINSIVKSTPEHVFLLLVDGRCEGVLAGVELPMRSTKERAFQEIMFYINSPFGKHVRLFIKNVEECLQSLGFKIIIMSVVENQKTVRLKSLYEKFGYKPMETHYMRAL